MAVAIHGERVVASDILLSSPRWGYPGEPAKAIVKRNDMDNDK